MTRPKCTICEGTGKVESISFGKPRRMVERTCGHCHGRKVMAYRVDLYDVLEYLRGVGSGGFDAAADGIEKRFGPAAQSSTAAVKEKP